MNSNKKQLLTTSEFIKKYALDAKKSLGQNFILDKNFTDKIAKSALEKGKSDFSGEIILEIGPGPASLTRSILDLNPQKLIVIEKDARCIKILQEIQEFYGHDKLEIINADALEVDELELITKFIDNKNSVKIKIISNLPYNVGTVLLLKWLKIADKISSMTLMLQKEVAQRITAKVNDKNYSRISIITGFKSDSKLLFEVNKSIFTPPPKVTSAIVQILPHQMQKFQANFNKLEQITAKAFNQKRKMIKSALKGAKFKDEISIDQVLKNCQIDENLRPQNIEIAKFCQLSEFLCD